MFGVKFYDIGMVEDYLDRLPTFRTDNVVVNGRVVRDYRAVVREDNEQVVAIVSSIYKLAQHKIVFKIFLERLEKYYPREFIKGYVTSEMTRAFLFVTVKEQEIEDDSRYYYGFLVTNSVDATMGIHVNFFRYRLVCSNGLISRQNIVELTQRHVQGQQTNFWKVLKEKYDRAIMELDKYIDDYIKMVKIAKDTIVNVPEILKKMDISQEAKKFILYKCGNEATLFDVYQALTNFYSHRRDSRLTMNGRIEKLKEAEKLIAIPVKQ